MRLPRPRFSLAQLLLLVALVGILLATGVALRRHWRRQAGGWPTAVQFSPDGHTLAVAYSRPRAPASVLLWDLHSGRQRGTLTGNRGEIVSLAFTPDSIMLVTGGAFFQPEEILLWDVPSGGLRARLAHHAMGVRSIAISPDGKTMATSGFDGTARLWDLAAARELATLGSSSLWPWCTLAISPDGRTFAWRDAQGNIALRDINTREQVGILKTDFPAIRLAFSPDGKLLAAVEHEGPMWWSGTTHLKLWNVSTQSVVRAFGKGRSGSPDPVFSPDGRKLAAAPGQFISVWDVKSGEETGRFRTPGYTPSFAFSPDGQTLAVAAGAVKLWHLPSDSVETLRVAEDEPFNWHVLGAGFLAWTIAAASLRQRRLSRTSVFLGVAWAIPLLALLLILATGLHPLHQSTSTILTADGALVMLGLVLASFRAEKVGLRGLFVGEVLWAFKGLCLAAFVVLITLDQGHLMVPLSLKLLTVVAVLALLRIRSDRARGAPWQHWVGLGVAIVEPMLLVALYAFPQAY